jgi:maltose 6'-phosphate phosphatase
MGDWNSNAAKIINDRLPEPFHIYTDWSHLGFDRYREGLAILSRYPLIQEDSLYVSDSQDPYSIHSRKVLMAEIDVPFIGVVNVYSTHLSWWEDGFASQFKRLREWAKAKHTPDTQATLLCGDFNVAVGSKGYQLVLESNDYDDQYLKAKTAVLSEQNYRLDDPYWQNYQTDDYRIDYVFMSKVSQLQVMAAQSVFTEEDYGKVSDHCGYLMSFEPK